VPLSLVRLSAILLLAAAGVYSVRTIFFSLPQGTPAWRYYAAMASDDSSRQLILYGGAGLAQAGSRRDLFDTWVRQGEQWHQHIQDGGPRLFYPLMTFDQHRQQVVLIGSTETDRIGTRGNPVLSQTWVWDRGLLGDGSWRQLHPETSPTNLELGSTVAYDSVRGGIFLLADTVLQDLDHLTTPGYGGGYVVGHELWSWDGQTWTETPDNGPISDPRPYRVVSAPDGGVLGIGLQPDPKSSGQVDGALYRWTGSRWQPLVVDGTPGTITGLALDAKRHQLVAIGGKYASNPDGAPASASTYVFNGTTWSSRSLPAALQGRVNMEVAWYGAPSSVALFGGASGCGGWGCGPKGQQMFRETWYWNGDSWHLASGG